MIVINLIGGLGNQMFQFAFGKYLALEFGLKLFLNISIYDKGLSNRTFDLNIFDIKKVIIGDCYDLAILAKSKELVYIDEKTFTFDLDHVLRIKNIPDKIDKLIIINGYWQSEQYFKKRSVTIKRMFAFKNPLEEKWKILNDKIRSCNSIMINVRRGDYLQKLNYHGVVSIEYLEKAILAIYSKVPNPFFFIFSDDMEWCRQNITGVANIFFVNEEYYGPKYSYYLQLMSNCKHFIISNSTFAWWSAYIATNKNKIVIAPKNWFACTSVSSIDLIPSKWIQL